MSTKNNLDVFEKIAAQKKQTVPPHPEVSRRSGWIIGGLAGLGYGLGALLLPALLMPGAPLARLPFGAVGNLLMAVFVGAVLGGICLLPSSGVAGAFLAVGGVWALSAARTLMSGSAPLSPFMNQAVGMYLFLLALGLVAVGTPYFLALRRAAERQGELWHRPSWDWARLQLPLILILVASAAAVLSLPSDRVRVGMMRMHNMMDAGPGSPASPSGPLGSERVQDFAAHARQPYTLEYSPDEALRSDLAPIVAPLDVVITAIFADGYRVSCMFKDGIDVVLCKSFAP